MSLRPKTKRRLLVLGTLLLVVGGVSFWVYRGPAAKAAAQAARHREAGMAAYARGDHAAAMPQLSDYLTLAKRDNKEWGDAELEALYAFADCRRHIPRPRRAHLAEAALRFNQFLEQRPADIRGRRALMEVVQKLRESPESAPAAGGYPELTEFADRLLAADPKDVSALLVKGNALLRRKPADLAGAKACADQLVAVAPNDYRGHVLAQAVSVARGTPAEHAIAAAIALNAAHPNEPGFALVVAATYRELVVSAPVPAPGQANGSATAPAPARPRAQTDEELFAESRKWYLAAAALPPPDAAFAAELVMSLDDARLYGTSIEYLRTALKTVPDRELEWVLVRKLWQVGAFDEVLERTAKLNPAEPTADAELLGWRAMVLQSKASAAAAGSTERSGLQAQADALTTALQARKDEDVKAWVGLLGAEAFSASADRQVPGTALAVATRYRGLRQADRADQENAVLLGRLGDAAADLGEIDEALRWWDRASVRQRDWAYPRLRGAVALFGMRQIRESHDWAVQAAERNPDDRQAAAVVARCRVEQARRDPGATPAALSAALGHLADVQRRWPNEPTTLPLFVAFTARSAGAPAAVERVTAALSANPPLAADTILELLKVDRDQKLGQYDALVVALERYVDNGPAALASWRAGVKLQEGNADEALKELDRGRVLDNQKRDHVWQGQIARAKEATGDAAGAVAVWAKLAAERPADLEVQEAVLNSPACRADRALWRQTIDRVKAVTGEESTRWRRAEAQWLLAAPNPSPEDRKRAVALLTEAARRGPRSADAQNALGIALLADGAFEPAAKAFEAALKLQPGDPDTIVRLAAALRWSGKSAAARQVLQPLTSGTRATPGGGQVPLTPAQRTSAARELGEAGDARGAAALLAPLPASAERNAMLGVYLARAGRADEAESAFDGLVSDPAAGAGGLFTAAEFFAAAGKPDKAKKCLDRLATKGLPEEDLQIQLGRFDEAHGTPADALAHYKKATEAMPDSAAARLVLAGYQVRTGNLDAAATTIDAGLAAVVSPAAGSPAASARDGLQALKGHLQTARGLATPADATPLLVILSNHPRHEAATALLSALAQFQGAVKAAADQPARDRARDQYVKTLANLAAKHADFWELQEQVVELHLRAGRGDDAARVAAAAVDRFPTDPRPPEVAARTSARLGNWDKVLEYAREWRSRLPGDALPADLMVAEALLRRKDRAEAARTLEQHVAGKPLPQPAGGSTATTAPAGIQASLLQLHLTYARALIELGRPGDATERLRPLLQLGPVGRSAWLSLAGSHERAFPARRWVEEAVRALPADASADERLAVARAWLAAGTSTGDPDAFRQSLDVTVPLTTGEAPPVPALMVRATAAHYLGDYATAEQAWRAIVRQSPDPGSTNNLAYVVLVRDDPKDRAEALDLAKRARDAAPTDVAIVTTVALGHARTGARDLAVRTYREALAIDPQYVEAMLGLAEELSRGTPKDVAEARQLVAQVRTKLRGAGQQLPEIGKQLDAVSRAVEISLPR